MDGPYLVLHFFSEFDCECIKWDQCSWSNDAFIRAKGLSRESEEYEQIKEKIRKHTCGESSQHMVYCCSSNQGSPDEIKALETGMIVCIDRPSGSHVHNGLKSILAWYYSNSNVKTGNSIILINTESRPAHSEFHYIRV